MSLQPQKSAQIAIGGVFSSLCLLIMFLSSVVPFSSFALPMMAGAALFVVVIENGAKTAALVYISVSLLSLFIVPDLDTKLMFILIFGYYPALRPLLEKNGNKYSALFLKLLVFNAGAILAYYLSLKLTGLQEVALESEFLTRYAIAIFLAVMNFTFLVYDHMLARLALIYLRWFRPTFLRR